MARSKKQNPKSKRKKVFLAALGVGIAGGAAYLGYEYYKNRKVQSGETPAPILPGIKVPLLNATTDKFPLKQGSKGNRVTLLQHALSRLIGEAAMKVNGGIDGIFGSGTANALKQAGFPVEVSEALFNQILSKAQSSSVVQVVFNPADIASKLYQSAAAKKLDAVINELRRIKTTSDYSQVNEAYKKIGIVSKTIVTDLLDIAFKGNETAKSQIRTEFTRIGLKNNPSTGIWTLNGISLYKELITIGDTYVTDDKGIIIQVRRNTVLGEEVGIENGVTWFKGIDNRLAYVPSKDVKYLIK